MEKYNPAKIEKKWQNLWEESNVFHCEYEPDKEKFYALLEFPYPSGQGLHVGHPRPYTALDVVSRKKRMQGYNVLFPMGFDAFGLPTENYAIKKKIHPRIVTEQNIVHFKEQLKILGFSFDWDRAIDTTDPDYYRWTQWIFIQMFKKGLAYKKETPINWCPSCKVGLANEEVIQGNCERCGTPVVHKVKNQWMLKITEYADRLIDDLDEVDYLPKIKQQQINWIGRSHGCEVTFHIENSEETFTVYTTRPDTLFGVSYVVFAPEHPLIKQFSSKIENLEEVHDYQHAAALKSDFERGELNKDKTGVQLKGIYAVHPITKKLIPVWVSDYVLMSYGTGAVMAVPAHDTRDWEFAKKFNLPIIEVIAGSDVSVQEQAYTETEEGKLVHSDFLNGLSVKEAKEKIVEYLVKENIGKKKTNYKLRDWIFSRQRYWGEPIPMVYCETHGWVPVPEEELPLRLPEVEKYEPTDDGESPLSAIPEFVNTTCPICHGPAKRETDTMPQWAGSSWYYLRYMDPKNKEQLVSKKAEKYFGPVDWYNGGMEHTTLHLLYSRFWHKFLYDIGVVSTKEPYTKRTSHGMILGSNGEKMSKSRGNVLNPDDYVKEYGADALRTYEMFIGDFEKGASWQEDGLMGCRKFLDRVWRFQEILVEGEEISKELEKLFHQTIKKVSEDYEALKFNTAIAQMMTLSNEIRKKHQINKKELEIFLLLLNPVAPHITEEIWDQQKYPSTIAQSGKWPEWDESKLVSEYVEMPVQVNGKVKGTIVIQQEEDRDSVIEKAKNLPAVMRLSKEKPIKKVIYVPNKILNIVL